MIISGSQVRWHRTEQTGGTSNITASKALERVSLEQCFEQMKVTKEMFPDPYELGLISTAIYEWDLMAKEHKILAGFIGLMKPDERSLFLPYIRREKRVADIAAELCLEWESANKKVYRIRKVSVFTHKFLCMSFRTDVSPRFFLDKIYFAKYNKAKDK